MTRLFFIVLRPSVCVGWFLPLVVLCMSSHKLLGTEQASGMAAGSEGGKEESAGGSDFWWDVGGWVLLGVAIMGAITIARVTAAPTASS